MDPSTRAAYDRSAAGFAREWEEQPPPDDMYDIVRQFFRPGATADIGCGSGRDTAWLVRNGYAAVGYDASPGLLAEAAKRHPGIAFASATLPDLDGIADRSFANVLCETVIMHVPTDAIGPSVRRLRAILRPSGTLYLSWRVTETADRRDEHGRLYAAFDPAIVADALEGTELLLDEQRVSASSGKPIRRLVVRAVG